MLFSIPWAFFDVATGTIGMLLFFAGFSYSISAVVQFITLPIFFILGVFGEIFLIPLGFFSPLMIIGGIALWFYGIFSGVDLSLNYYFSYALYFS